MPAAYAAAGTVNRVTAPAQWAYSKATVKQAIADLVPDSIFN